MSEDRATSADPACGVCAGDVPPLVGSRLTGTGLTLDAAAAALVRDGRPPTGLTPVQARLVEERALQLEG